MRRPGWIIPGDRQRYEGKTAQVRLQRSVKTLVVFFIAFVVFGLQLPGPLMLRLMTTRAQCAARRFVMNIESNPAH